MNRLKLATVFGVIAGHSLGAQDVARLRILPVHRSFEVGDSLRLEVQALDARGNPIPTATIRFTAQGGRFQGNVDSSGTVRGGAPGTVPIAVLATTPGGRPLSEKIEVRILPSAAARITLEPSVTRMLAGQRLHIGATVWSASGDEREGDVVSWRSTNTAVLRVADGVVTPTGPGAARLTATAGRASASVPIQVLPPAGVTIGISPARVTARRVTSSDSRSMCATLGASASAASGRRGASHPVTAPLITTALSLATEPASTSSRPILAHAMPRQSSR